MTQDEFRDQLEQFLYWTSNRDRPASLWFLSLETWAREFNRYYDLEEEQRRKKGNQS